MDAPAPSARERLGRSLVGKYRLESILGAGGTAVVYRASDRHGEPVAIKVLHEYLSTSQEVCARFEREIYVANLLDHPGTVKVLDDGVTEDGTLFFVLELLEGETLEDCRARAGGTLPLDQVLDIVDRILAVLELAHARGVVHRDIKPSNVFLTRDGVLKVLDFGIARFVEGASSATVTKTGQTMGTPAFMPPEQALSKPREIDAQSDLWAVGATMFTLLSGEHVHAAESASEHLVKAATAPARSLATVARAVPANVEAFVARALSFTKAGRFRDAAEMRAALAAVKASPGPLVGTHTSPPPSRVSASNAPTILSRPSNAPGATPMTVSGIPAPLRGSVRGKRAWWVAVGAAALLLTGIAARAVQVATSAPAAAAERIPAAAARSSLAPPAATALPERTPEPAASTAGSLTASPPATASAASPAPPPSKPAAKAASAPGGALPRPATTAKPAAAKPKSTADLYRPW